MTKTNQNLRDEKRAQFSPSRRKKRGVSPAVWILGLLGVVGVGGVLIALLSGPSRSVTAAGPAAPGAAQQGSRAAPAAGLVAATVGHAPYPEVKALDGVLRIPLEDLSDGQAHYFTYMNDGQPIEFFVVRDGKGEVRLAFNACDVCFQARKGYHQEGDELVCNNCGRRFPIAQVGAVSGGCNPSPLVGKVEGSSVMIRVQDLVPGLYLFTF